jgi:ABC-type sugar transport system permease subunit
MINVGKSGLNFLFSVIHTTLNVGEGGIYALVSNIFAPDCRRLVDTFLFLPHMTSYCVPITEQTTVKCNLFIKYQP